MASLIYLPEINAETWLHWSYRDDSSCLRDLRIHPAKEIWEYSTEEVRALMCQPGTEQVDAPNHPLTDRAFWRAEILKRNQNLPCTDDRRERTGRDSQEEAKSTRTFRFFISYRRQDSDFQAQWIYRCLCSEFGDESTFIDVDRISPGLDFRNILADEVSRCDIFLAIIGDRWLSATDQNGNRRLDDPSDFVRIEIESALERDIPVIPVVVGHASIPSEQELPASLKPLAHRHAILVRTGRDIDSDLAKMLDGIKRLLAQIKEKQSGNANPKPRHTAVTTDVERTWHGPVDLVATDTTNLSRNLRKKKGKPPEVINGWMDEDLFVGYRLIVRLLGYDENPEISFVPHGDSENQKTLKADRQKELWYGLVKNANKQKPIRLRIEYRYEKF